MNTIHRLWYLMVVTLVALGVIGGAVALATPAQALDTDRHGRFYAYPKKIKTINPDGSTCLTYQPVRKNLRTGKVKYAARYANGKKIPVDKSTCGPHWDYGDKAPTGFRIIDMSRNGRYLWFYAYPYPTLEVEVTTVYRKDFKTGRLKNLGQVQLYYPLNFSAYM